MQLLKKKYSDNSYLDVYPAFLAGCSNILKNIDERMDYTNTIYKIYNPESRLLIGTPRVEACFFQQPDAFVIDTDGSILCCDRDIGKQKTKVADVYSVSSFDGLKKPENLIPDLQKQCRLCIYYPKCGGGCKATYNTECCYDACFMERYKTEFFMNKIIGY